MTQRACSFWRRVLQCSVVQSCCWRGLPRSITEPSKLRVAQAVDTMPPSPSLEAGMVSALYLVVRIPPEISRRGCNRFSLRIHLFKIWVCPWPVFRLFPCQHDRFTNSTRTGRATGHTCVWAFPTLPRTPVASASFATGRRTPPPNRSCIARAGSQPTHFNVVVAWPVSCCGIARPVSFTMHLFNPLGVCSYRDNCLCS